MNDPTYFCENCFSNNELKGLVRASGIKLEKCAVCFSENVLHIDSSNHELRDVTRALVRIYYSEYEYNLHLGGTHLSRILFGSNEIFDLDSSADQAEFESAFDDIDRDWYPASHDQIALGGGYWDGGVLLSFTKHHHEKIFSLAERALRVNSYELLEEAKSIFVGIDGLVRESIGVDSNWFRARLGFAKKFKSWMGGYRPHYAYEPYESSGVGSPPPHVASEGRLNRYRTSVLYLASDELTAISEIRPHPGHIVSVGQFHPKQEISIANLASPKIGGYAKDRLLSSLHLAISLGTFANLPVTPETRHWYMATQLIGDAAREAGFQGIMFRSTVSSGTNLVVFDPSLFDEAHKVTPVEVKGVSYTIAPLLDTRSVDLEDFDEDEDQFHFNEMLSRKT